jgi:hypothetical protein
MEELGKEGFRMKGGLALESRAGPEPQEDSTLKALLGWYPDAWTWGNSLTEVEAHPQPEGDVGLLIDDRREIRSPEDRWARAREGFGVAAGRIRRVDPAPPHSQRLKHTVLGSVISWRAKRMPSRPSPEFLIPPKGMASMR